VKNMSRSQRHKRGKSGGMPSRRHPHRALAKATLDTALAATSQCEARSRLAPGSTNCVPFDGTTDIDPAVACAWCAAGLTSRARPLACPVLRLGPEHLAVIWNCAWDETGVSGSIGVSSPFSVFSRILNQFFRYSDIDSLYNGICTALVFPWGWTKHV
jgi:hypothetical protein